MAIGAIPGYSYVIHVKVDRAPATVYGVFDAWHLASKYRNERIPKAQRKHAVIMPINGIG